jgi:hypothetical protein
MDYWTIESLHDFIMARVREIVPEAEHQPLLVIVGADGRAHFFPLLRVMKNKPVAAALCREAVRLLNGRLAATIHEAWAVTARKNEPLDSLIPADDPRRQEVLVVSIEEPGRSQGWMYEIVTRVDGKRALGAEIPVNGGFDWNRFALFHRSRCIT